MKFVGIVGSNAELSYNRKLLHFIKKHFEEQFELEILEIDEIPLLILTGTGMILSSYVFSTTRLHAQMALSLQLPSITTLSLRLSKVLLNGSPMMYIRLRISPLWLSALLTTTKELLARKFI